MLFCTGLRIGEALNLNYEDVNLENMTIYVKPGKTGRDRLIPISKTTTIALQNYREKRDQIFKSSAAQFFQFDHGPARSKYPFENRFRRASGNLGYRKPNQRGYDASSLRAHDLRHSFAVNTLISCYKKDCIMNNEVPKLTVLMGHNSARETYYYIEAIPELMELAMRRTQDGK